MPAINNERTNPIAIDQSELRRRNTDTAKADKPIRKDKTASMRVAWFSRSIIDTCQGRLRGKSFRRTMPRLMKTIIVTQAMIIHNFRCLIISRFDSFFSCAAIENSSFAMVKQPYVLAPKSLPILAKHPTACVTRWWAGRENATLPEPTPSHTNCLKTRRLPPVGCTLCWAVFMVEVSTMFQ